MNERLLIFEGYDGSGKGTLINELARVCRGKIRIIGRKDETGLKGMAQLIESSAVPLSRDAEMLLRLAIEFERLLLVAECSPNFDALILDRGLLSVKSWVDYYNLDPETYAGLFEVIEHSLEGATLFLCCCDFETCWSRIKDRNHKSRKELLGKRINQMWYQKYTQNCDAFCNARYKTVRVDTTCGIQQSLDTVVSNIRDTFDSILIGK